jgi:hypothetical protein
MILHISLPETEYTQQQKLVAKVNSYSSNSICGSWYFANPTHLKMKKDYPDTVNVSLHKYHKSEEFYLSFEMGEIFGSADIVPTFIKQVYSFPSP